jgi:hypothetical protein
MYSFFMYEMVIFTASLEEIIHFSMPIETIQQQCTY